MNFEEINYANATKDSKSYSREEVLTIVSQIQATTSDYLIRTYFKIFRIDEGPVYDKFKRRFNNIVFNNFTEIFSRLTETIFARRALDLVRRDLIDTRFVSCIVPNNLEYDSYPVFIQYFDPKRGIEHCLLQYTSTPSALSTILSEHNVVEKIVGYCGEYSCPDPGTKSYTDDHFTSLRILSGNRSRNLPYSDGFVDHLFDFLLDYLPLNVSTALDKLGQTLIKTRGVSQFGRDLVAKYKEWMKSDEHILLSDYATFVVENFDAVNTYLLPFQQLSFSIGSLFSSVYHRFMLVFMQEIFHKVNAVKLNENCAVLYYFNLLKILSIFKSYEDANDTPTKAWTYFYSTLEYLTAKEQIHPVEDVTKVDKIIEDITIDADLCYARAIKYLEPLLEQFENFDNFAWILLTNSNIDEVEVHQSYHVIKDVNCSNCDHLMDEINHVKIVLAKLPLLEIDSVVTKWVMILNECRQLSKIVEILEYVFSLPASCNVISEIRTDNEFKRIESMIRMNMKRVSSEEVVDCVGEFFGEYLEEAEEIVKKNRIPLLLD
jgi:hypothetical protein